MQIFCQSFFVILLHRITCIFLACKVEEYYVSIQNFASNCSLMPKEACEKVVRDNELLVMLKLHYHLTIYKPYKAIDGFLLDIRVRLRTNFHLKL